MLFFSIVENFSENIDVIKLRLIGMIENLLILENLTPQIVFKNIMF